MRVNEKEVKEAMLSLGHPDHLAGTEYLQIAVGLYERDCSMTKEIYPGIAAAVGSTATRVERCMRHSIETAWIRGSMDAQQRIFGYTVDPKKGRPTVGEYIARMANYCREN